MNFSVKNIYFWDELAFLVWIGATCWCWVYLKLPSRLQYSSKLQLKWRNIFDFVQVFQEKYAWGGFSLLGDNLFSHTLITIDWPQQYHISIDISKQNHKPNDLDWKFEKLLQQQGVQVFLQNWVFHVLEDFLSSVKKVKIYDHTLPWTQFWCCLYQSPLWNGGTDALSCFSWNKKKVEKWNG